MFRVSAVESCILASREPAARFYFVKLFVLEKSKVTAHFVNFHFNKLFMSLKSSTVILRGIRLCSKIVFFLAVVLPVIALSDSFESNNWDRRILHTESLLGL